MRTFGSETEFGMYVVNKDGKEMSHSTVDTQFRPESIGSDDFSNLYVKVGKSALEALGIASNDRGFLSNGGRLYYDINALEYATPECSSAERVAIAEISGEILVAKVLDELKKQGFIGGYQLNKRSSDHARNSWGSHENISSSDRELYAHERNKNFLASHYLTRVIYTGAGGFIRNSRGNYRYVISPRLFSTREAENTSRTGSRKPLLNTWQGSDYNGVRYQQANAEANTSPWSIKMRHATNSLIYTLVEQNLMPEELTIRDPVSHAANVTMSLDLRSNIPLEITNSKVKLNPINWQHSLAEHAQKLSNKFQFSSDELWAIKQILEITDSLRNNPYLTDSRVEWIKRREYIESKLGLPIDVAIDDTRTQDRALKLDYLWDAIGFGSAKRLRDKGWGWYGFANQPDSDDLDRNWQTPPGDTRAAIRANFVRKNPTGVQNWYTMANENEEYVELHASQTKLP